ncbi:hypothetical protein OPV22_034163 [Ensete ventricosum]|uniref:Translation machinery-associated protein 7 homolog n=1 Tax=Ensete ventricosum TaxID=4639 RepID=A0AAV8PRP6_ENSVE|nr:hypothetical protein OPV22_034163 [Ensete ventricosum]
MSSKLGGKLKPLKQPKADKKEYDEADIANIQKKKDEEKALKELRAKASQKGTFGGTGVCIRTYALGFQMNSSKSVKGLFWRWRKQTIPGSKQRRHKSL